MITAQRTRSRTDRSTRDARRELDRWIVLLYRKPAVFSVVSNAFPRVNAVGVLESISSTIPERSCVVASHAGALKTINVFRSLPTSRPVEDTACLRRRTRGRSPISQIARRAIAIRTTHPRLPRRVPPLTVSIRSRSRCSC